MSKTAITIEIDEAELAHYTNDRLALCWHVAQANPAPHGDHRAGELTERIGREIIRRWLAGVQPELWRHQGRSHYWAELIKFARYIPGGAGGYRMFHEGRWVPQRCEHDPAPSGERCDTEHPATDTDLMICALAAGHDCDHWDPAVRLHWRGEGIVTGWCQSGKTDVS